MLARRRALLQAVQIAILAVGTAGWLVFLARLYRTERWRNPLADRRPPAGGPTVPLAAGLFILFCLLPLLVRPLLAYGVTAQDLQQPGSAGWHRALAADDVTKAGLCGVMIVVLVWTRRATDEQPRLGLARTLALGGGGFLLAMPPVMLQLYMGVTIWHWLQPQQPPPVHPMLQALESSAAGRWGAAQLVLGATVLAPVTEELLFRGVLLQALWRQWRLAWGAILASAGMFSLVHGQPQDLLPLVTLGTILGYVRVRSGSLWAPILLHVLFNARTMLFAILDPTLIQDAAS
jgi:membrane protease YdiL (CAAX protease family)